MTTMQRQTAVIAYLSSKQLLLFVFELQDSILPLSNGIGLLTAMQRQTAVTGYCISKQLLLFVLARENRADLVSQHALLTEVNVEPRFGERLGLVGGFRRLTRSKHIETSNQC